MIRVHAFDQLSSDLNHFHLCNDFSFNFDCTMIVQLHSKICIKSTSILMSAKYQKFPTSIKIVQDQQGNELYKLVA